MRITNESYMIGYQGENYSRDIKYEISDNFKDFRIFIEFEKPNGEKFTTKQLEDIESGIYKVPYELLNECGNLEVQLVGVNEDGIIHKSMPKTFYVSQSINAIDELIESENGWQLVEDIYSRGVALQYDEKTGVVSLLGKDKNGNDIVLSSIDLPSERVIKSIYYDEEKKSLVFEFDNYPSVEVKIELNDFVKKENIATINGEEITNGGNITTKDISVNEVKQLFTSGKGSEGLSTNYEYQLSANVNKGRQRACVYGNGYFVMVGASGQVEYSQDNGATWKSIPKFANGTLTGLAYGNGVFVLVEYETKKIWSVDIPTNEWKNVYTFENNMLEGCRYVNNEFVVVGTYGLIAKSNDGKAWRVVHTYEDNINLYDIAYGNGKYIVVGQGGLTLNSINGNIWYENQLDIITTDIRSVAYANGNFVLGTSGGVICYSSDGINWQQTSNPSELAIAWVRGFAYGDNRLYACMYASNGKGELWYSEDKGKTWSVALTIAQRLWCCCYGGDTFILGGESGIVYYLDLEIEWQETNPNSEVVYYKQVVIQNDGSTTQSDVYKEENSTTQELMKEVTYDELVALRDNSQLVAGQQYRIIDYVTTTCLEQTKSAGNKFDIIVTALSENKLDERAKATYNKNDDYFIKKETIEYATGTFKEGITYENIEPLVTIAVDDENVAGYEQLKNGADIIVEIGYFENAYGVEVPVFYKNDVGFVESGEEGPDYSDVFYYIGTYEYEGVMYDRWHKYEHGVNGLEPTSYYVLTNIVVDKGETIKEEKSTKLANLDAWELKYCLDNDETRFTWAYNSKELSIINLESGYGNGKPLIRQPEFDNGLIFENYEEYKYAWGTLNDVNDKDPYNFYYSKNEVIEDGEKVLYCQSQPELVTARVSNGGKGVIYWLKDEWGNECSYDFKNILSYREGAYFYTFYDKGKDATLFSQGIFNEDLDIVFIQNNIIKESYDDNRILTLSCNIFIYDTYYDVTSFYNNYIGYDSYYNLIHANRFRNNIIGNNFINNKLLSFLTTKHNNIIGNNFNNNETRGSIANLTIGNGVIDCIFTETINGLNIPNLTMGLDIPQDLSSEENEHLAEIEKINKMLDAQVIPSYYFEGNKSLISAYFEMVDTISDYSFVRCPNLISIDFGEPHNYGKYCFAECRNLKSFNISKNAITIPKSMFYGCSSLEKVYIPSSIKKIEDDSFFRCEQLKQVFYDGTINDWVNIDFDEDVGSSPFFSGDGALYCENKLINEVNIYQDVKPIVFAGCGSIEKVNLYSANDIGYASFWNNSNLKELTIYPDVEKINDRAFYSCNNLKIVKIYKGKVSLGEDVFGEEHIFYCEENSKPESWSADWYQPIITKNYVKIYWGVNENTLKTIDNIDYYISDNEITLSYVHPNAIKIKIPETINIDGLEKVCNKIGRLSFRGNEKIMEVEIPNNITEIESYAFFKCVNLKKVTLPSSINTIPSQCFRFCKNLRTIEIPNNIESIESAFGHSGIKEINTNNALVNCYAFSECYLDKLTIPYGITGGAWDTFDGEIKILDVGGHQNTTIKHIYLQYPKKLEKLIVRVKNKVLTLNQKLSSSCVIYVPDDLVEQYKVATNWVSNASNIKPLSEYVEEE